MMKRRTINTKMWEDPFFEDLSPNEKLVFIYLITNPMTNILGIYEVSLKRISFDTGVDKNTIKKALETFQSNGKVYYIQNYIIMPNFLKNQALNGNMWKGAVDLFNKLPNWLKTWIEQNLYESFERLFSSSKDFERTENPMQTPGENESENEGESKGGSKKGKDSNKPHSFDNSLCANFQYVKENIGEKYQKYDIEYYWEVTKNWAESKDVRRKNWLAQIRGIIQKDEREGKAKIVKQTQKAPL